MNSSQIDQKINSSELLAQNGSAKPCDSNNNAGESFLTSRGDRKQQHHQEDSSSGGEEWHILDVDDEHQKLRRGDDEFLAPSRNADATRYIELDPLGPSSRQSSAALVFLCTAIYSLLPLASLLAALSLMSLLFTRFYYVTLAYMLYVLLDKNTCNRGGRRIDAIYRSKFWSHLAAYFPIKLRQTPEFKLDPGKNYVLNYHPHGISAFGSVCAFATNGLRFSELFPGIKSRFMVHESSFIMPIMKETFSLRGDCSVNSKSIDYMLSRAGTGNLLTIVVGGLAEADLSDMETLKIVITKRKGFIKKALIHGADIIPCIAFGENSVFKKVNLHPSTLMYKLENSFYNLFKFKHPIYYGRSVLTEQLTGVMPYKRPITVVLGNPISVSKVESPSQEDIDSLHDKYLEQLKSMYSDNRDLCSVYDKVLELI